MARTLLFARRVMWSSNERFRLRNCKSAVAKRRRLRRKLRLQASAHPQPERATFPVFSSRGGERLWELRSTFPVFLTWTNAQFTIQRATSILTVLGKLLSSL